MFLLLTERQRIAIGETEVSSETKRAPQSGTDDLVTVEKLGMEDGEP